MDIRDFFEGLVSMMAMSIPILTVVGVLFVRKYHVSRDYDLRSSLVENHVDAETSRIIMSKRKESSRRGIFTTLRMSLALTFMGLAYVFHELVMVELVRPSRSIDPSSEYIIVLATGAGIGLFIAVLIQYYMEKRQRGGRREDESETEGE